MHLQQLRKGKRFDLDGKQEHKATALLDKAEHFLFTGLPDPESPDVLESVKCMREAGVLRLPYPVCTLEISNFYLWCEGADIPPIDKPTVFLVLGLDPLDCIMFVRMQPKRWVAVDIAERKFAPEPFSVLINACIVSLATKGIRKERWVGDRKLQPGKIAPRGISYTKVLVREASEQQGHRGEAGDHHRVRLHLRRGHLRNQPYGPGRGQTKLVFIEPMLVGYEEAGMVSHTSYTVHPAAGDHAA